MTLSDLAPLALALLLPLRLAAGAARTVPVDSTLPRSLQSSSFATSLQIAAPGARAEPDGMSYRLTLEWTPRAGAAGYRVFTWTDAARAWYRADQTSTTRADMRAFKSGCTAFVVVAVADMSANPKSLVGVDTTNVVRFPLSTQQALCPAKL